MPFDPVSKLAHLIFQRPRVWKYRLLSTCRRISGRAARNQPLLIMGQGSVAFAPGSKFGYRSSPGFYNGVIHIEARNPQSQIDFGRNLRINNNCAFIAEGEGIEIGDNAFIGMNVLIMDSDGHPIDPRERQALAAPATARVMIGRDVFLGAHVTVLKGARIGDRAVVSAHTVVTGDLEGDAVYAGIPARMIRKLS